MLDEEQYDRIKLILLKILKIMIIYVDRYREI